MAASGRPSASRQHWRERLLEATKATVPNNSNKVSAAVPRPFRATESWPAPLPEVENGDWLDGHDEGGGQTVVQWQKRQAMNEKRQRTSVRADGGKGSASRAAAGRRQDRSETIVVVPFVLRTRGSCKSSGETENVVNDGTIDGFPHDNEEQGLEGFPDVVSLHAYLQAFFFGRRVEFSKHVLLRPDKASLERGQRWHENRMNESTLQFKTTSLHDELAELKSKRPEVECMVGVLAEDLYPRDSWNFVFGQARLKESVGVFSFARFVDDDGGRDACGGLLGSADAPRDASVKLEEATSLLFLRAVKLVSHELMHMYQIKHCVFANCVMRGSNSLPESDSKPAHLCPVCLRKLQLALGFCPSERYAALGSFWREKAESLHSDNRMRRRFVALSAFYDERELESKPQKPAGKGDRKELVRCFAGKGWRSD